MNRIPGIIFCALIISFSNPAHAGYRFGTQQTVKKLEDIALKGKENEQLYLGHLVTSKFFLLGLFVKDDGYVLGVKGKANAYYPFPSKDIVKNLQENALLPKVLPAYTLSLSDYLLGYSLYISIVVIGIWGFLEKKFKKSRQKQ